ncbi:MAG TPA: hypothetical protein VFB14_05780 [Bryobacteraceae bacterium]|nr:hypothetical protein [Bryobacteraceae bacterium]
MTPLSRRCFLWSGMSFGAASALPARVKDETVYNFATPACNIRMTIEFYDRYSSRGFWFEERQKDTHYCLSANGEKERNCLAGFVGSIAIARYRVQPRSQSPDTLLLRESVRTIDRDSRLKERAPYQRSLPLQCGLASDIQAFGYEAKDRSAVTSTESHEPWCLFRQDLYFDQQGEAFLVVHWKHTLSAIRVLDLIPGQNTRLVERR